MHPKNSFLEGQRSFHPEKFASRRASPRIYDKCASFAKTDSALRFSQNEPDLNPHAISSCLKTSQKRKLLKLENNHLIVLPLSHQFLNELLMEI